MEIRVIIAAINIRINKSFCIQRFWFLTSLSESSLTSLQFLDDALTVLLPVITTCLLISNSTLLPQVVFALPSRYWLALYPLAVSLPPSNDSKQLLDLFLGSKGSLQLQRYWFISFLILIRVRVSFRGFFSFSLFFAPFWVCLPLFALVSSDFGRHPSLSLTCF